jgi:quinolinate synthase
VGSGIIGALMNAHLHPHTELAARLAHVVPAAEIALAAPLIARIEALKAAHGALILAHNYQTPLVSAVADFTGDSLAMAQFALEAPARTLVVCGVRFMAETVKLLCPDKRVLLSAEEAGCSLADSIDAEAVRAVRAACPGVPAVAYINTSAAVKAEVDVCCTSANAVEIVAGVPGDRPVLFLPDQFLGAHVQRATGRANMHIWMGECHVHADISPQALREKAEAAPESELFIHPECGCATAALWLTGTGDLPATRTHVLSTGGMLERARTTNASSVLVATETGILHQLRRANPSVRFEPVNERAQCAYMKMTTPEVLLSCLAHGTTEVVVDADVAARARRAVDAMIAVGTASAAGE